jgi:hypothetical protein
MTRTLSFCLAVLFAASTAFGAEELPEDAARLLSAFEEDAEAMRLEAERKVALEKRELVKKLKELQDKYTRAALLDEAVAIRDKIRSLNESSHPSQPDPGNMSGCTNQIGQKFYFRVTGHTNGYVYGTDVYTYDSTIATAAVHTGALKVGETGVVKVTMLPGRPSYLSSQRNGVTSSQWSSYQASFQVERVKEVLLPPEDKPADKPKDPNVPDAPKAGAPKPEAAKPDAPK